MNGGSPRRVLLTGATSGLGLAVATALRVRGDEVVALVRPTSTTDVLYRMECRLVEGDVTDAPGTTRAARGCDAVIHAAAKVGDWGRPEDFVRVNVEGTRNVVRAAHAAGARLVHVSSASVYGAVTDAVVTEETTVRPSGLPYADSKLEGERAVFTFARESGLAATVVRPPLMYGPYDRTFLPRVAENLRRGRFAYVVDPKRTVNLAHMQHVVEVILRALEEPRAAGEAFNVCDGPPVPFGALVATACRHLGAPLPKLRVPSPLAHAAAGALETAYRLARREQPPPLTRYMLALLERNYTLSIEKARALLGWEPTIATLAGVAQACEALG